MQTSLFPTSESTSGTWRILTAPHFTNSVQPPRPGRSSTKPFDLPVGLQITVWPKKSASQPEIGLNEHFSLQHFVVAQLIIDSPFFVHSLIVFPSTGKSRFRVRGMLGGKYMYFSSYNVNSSFASIQVFFFKFISCVLFVLCLNWLSYNKQ